MGGSGGCSADRVEVIENQAENEEGANMSSYTVKKGDTLSKIGVHFGVNWVEIAKLNNIKSPYVIYPGQVLKTEESVPDGKYKVKKGDTLSGIGAELKIDWKEIASENNIISPYIIYPGQLLTIPSAKKEGVEGLNISPFVSDAQKLQQQTGIPASITLGQIILESTGKYPGGLSGLAYQGKNLFGIKGTGTAGTIAMPTTEYLGGVRTTVNASFAKYNSFYDSMVAHANLLSKERYAKYLKDAKSVNDYAEGIKKGGYATDPAYVSKLLNIIAKNNLHQYDIGSIAFKPISGSNSTGGSGSTGAEMTSIGSKVGKLMGSPMFWGLMLAALVVKP